MKSRLLIEGKYDGGIVNRICRRFELQIGDKFELVECGRIGALLDQLTVDTRVDVVAVICDADQDLVRRWDEIKGACSKGGLDLGNTVLPSSGLIWNEEKQQKFACWVMPDNQTSGAIEGRLAAGHRDPLQQGLHEQALAFVRGVQPRLFPNTVAADQKAGLRAWFAVQEEPVWVPSHAIAHQMLLPQLDRQDAFVQWLERVYALAG